jgi:hypothetical protein
MSHQLKTFLEKEAKLLGHHFNRVMALLMSIQASQIETLNPMKR